MTTPKIRNIRTSAKKTNAPKVEETQIAPAATKREMANPEPRPTHQGTASSTYRVGKKLTPLRTDYRCGQMSEKDNEFLREAIALGGKSGIFPRRNIDAGRLGRLYTLGFVTYEDIGVVTADQPIKITPKAKEYTKPVKAA